MAARSQQFSRCYVIVFVLLPDLEKSPVHFFEFIFSGVPESGRVPTLGGLLDPLFLPHGATGGT
ncbi:hypothetical protein DPMN_183610 [Dreissena polymorpha]|uniref:Uncharacterized protein n=1 Tax=Dreissena polymorpha TaxID=45954 RepID=A0A9D4DK89_DREPO|nr:hypothetical protein DPMN_183610 [Dreissena polymorpha]